MSQPVTRKFAIVTGASTGIGYELAREAAGNGYDLLIAADEAKIELAADELRALGGMVEAVQADLSGPEGVDKLYAAAAGRKIDALLANAGVDWAAVSWIRTQPNGATSSIPTSRAPCCYCNAWRETCAPPEKGAS